MLIAMALTSMVSSRNRAGKELEVPRSYGSMTPSSCQKTHTKKKTRIAWTEEPGMNLRGDRKGVVQPGQPK